MKHKRPVRHIRHVRTRRGRKAVVVNPNIILHHKGKKKVIKDGHKNYDDLVSFVGGAFKTAEHVLHTPVDAIHIAGDATTGTMTDIKHLKLGKVPGDVGKGVVGEAKMLGRGGITLVKDTVSTVKELPKKAKR